MARKPLSVQLAVLLLFAFCLRAEARAVRFVVGADPDFRRRHFVRDRGSVPAARWNRLHGSAARELVRERFLLEEDAQPFIRQAEDSHVLLE